MSSWRRIDDLRFTVLKNRKSVPIEAGMMCCLSSTTVACSTTSSTSERKTKVPESVPGSCPEVRLLGCLLCPAAGGAGRPERSKAQRFGSCEEAPGVQLWVLGYGSEAEQKQDTSPIVTRLFRGA